MPFDTNSVLGFLSLVGLFGIAVIVAWLILRGIVWAIFRGLKLSSKKSGYEAERTMIATINATCLGIPTIIFLAYPFSPIIVVLSWLLSWTNASPSIYMIALLILGIAGFSFYATILQKQFKRMGREISIGNAAKCIIFAFMAMIPSIFIISVFQFGYDEVVAIVGIGFSLVLLALLAYSQSKPTGKKS